MGDLVARILVAGLLLLSVVAAFDPEDLEMNPSSLSGRKFVKQNTHVPLLCSISAKNANVSLTSDVDSFKSKALPMPVKDKQGKTIGTRQSSATADIVHFGPSDVGTYSCHVSIQGEVVAEKSIVLELYQGLNLSTTPTSVLTHVGADETHLYCAVMHGVGGVNITWTNANGTEINAAFSSMFPRFTVQGPNLTIHQVERSDAGPYSCNAAQTIKNANDDGSDLVDADRATINLYVEHVPFFAHSEVEVQRDTKDALNLTCDAVTGVPFGLKSPSFSWYRNGTNMSEKGDDTFPACRERQCTVPFDDHHSLYDTIKCTADNGLGLAEKLFKVVEGIRQTTEADVPTGSPVANSQNMVPQVTGAPPTPQPGNGASSVSFGLAVLIGALCVAFV